MTAMASRSLPTALLLLCAWGIGVAQSPPSMPEELDQYVATAIKASNVPGLALSVVKDGRVVVAKGYGIRQLGKADLVDEHTVFDAASLTKSFTAAAVASLVDEGKMAWDEPVRRYIPELDFGDPYLSANVTLRDLLSHRTGIRTTNSAWYFTGVDRQRLLTLLKHMEAAAPFRTRWVYSNTGFTVAGEAAARAAGTRWDDLITKRFLEPLEMSRSTAVFAAVPGMTNVATGHALFSGTQRPAPREGEPRDVTGPAGAVQSSAADLARWMNFQLGDGTFNGRRLLSAASLQEMHEPQIVVPTPAAFRAARQMKHFAAYGLGWQVFDYRGSPLLWHSGNGDGQVAFMALLPEIRLGVTVLVNTWAGGGAAFNNAIASRIMDHFLGLPSRDYVTEHRNSWERTLKQEAEATRTLAASRVPNTRPTLPLSKYVGVYRDRMGLDLVVSAAGDRLVLQYGGGEPADLSHWNYDTFRTRWSNELHAEERAAFVQFVVGPDGSVNDMSAEIFGDRIAARRQR